MGTDDGYLVEHINQKLSFTADSYSTDKAPLDMHNIRGFSRSHRKGDIIIQFNNQEDSDTTIKTNDHGVKFLSPYLRLI